jgi:hypothetical protein
MKISLKALLPGKLLALVTDLSCFPDKIINLQPSMLVVPDIQDVYTPLQNHLIVPLSEVCYFLLVINPFVLIIKQSI